VSTVTPPSDTGISSRNLKHAVASYVREGVFAGTLKPGQRIDQDELADTLGVSKVPVREALIFLEAEALVINVPRRGTFVAPLSAEDIANHFHMTGLIAGFAASRATERLTQEDLAELERILQDMRYERDPAALQTLNDDFHRTINNAGCTMRIRSLLGLLADGIPGRFYEFAIGWSNIANDAHLKILEALKAKDADRVGELMSDHVRSGYEEAIKALEGLGFWNADDADPEDSTGSSIIGGETVAP
jgi:DNA-binding GntR family transcriptional regulator